ncbi:nitroreductase family protein [uncultured Shimia sp.]|uniref:nitroreductase family protein n=1 Tax=uncultured Shimia sp. TaxID=573152 RepID=UPI002609A073|nr:nitroreductase family protein [uncultured Shimia sp.]
MPEANPEALAFLLSRRSRPAKTLTTPVPSREELAPILEAGLRAPDHGKLEPWRLIVIEGRAVMDRLATLAQTRGEALGLDDEKIGKGRGQFDMGNLAVVVVESPVIAEKVPEIEQTYSAGAVCLQLLNAALAAGWGANWLSGWVSHDRDFLTEGLRLSPHERIAGIIHIGTEKSAPPERPRPDMEKKVTWVSR